MRLSTLSLPVFVVGLLSRSALAGIVSMAGAVEVVSPPADLRAGALESDTVISVFAERQGQMLVSDVSADITTPGESPLPSDPSNLNLSPGTLSAGTVVDSYFVHLDPITQTGLQGSLTFDREVLGLILSDETLAPSHAQLGFPGTIYGIRAQVEVGQDRVALSADRRTVSFNFNVLPSRDTMRIVTSGVPEPASLALAAIVMVFVSLLRLTARERYCWCGQ